VLSLLVLSVLRRNDRSRRVLASARILISSSNELKATRPRPRSLRSLSQRREGKETVGDNRIDDTALLVIDIANDLIVIAVEHVCDLKTLGGTVVLPSLLFLSPRHFEGESCLSKLRGAECISLGRPKIPITFVSSVSRIDTLPRQRIAAPCAREGTGFNRCSLLSRPDVAARRVEKNSIEGGGGARRDGEKKKMLIGTAW